MKKHVEPQYFDFRSFEKYRSYTDYYEACSNLQKELILTRNTRVFLDWFYYDNCRFKVKKPEIDAKEPKRSVSELAIQTRSLSIHEVINLILNVVNRVSNLLYLDYIGLKDKLIRL
jgi:hypothetical protein